MDTLYERCKNNKLIFTKLRPQTSPDHSADSQSRTDGSRNTELEEIFNRRSSAAASRMTPVRRPQGPDGAELDSDLDEARSELGSEIYSDAGIVSRRNRKLNRLMDLIQSDKTAPPSTPTESNKNNNLKEPETPNTTLTPSDPGGSPCKISSVSNTRVNKICGNFYWNLVTIISVAFGFVFTELVLKQSVKLLQLLKVWIEWAGNYMWNNFLATMATTEDGQREIFGKQWSKPGSGKLSVENMLLLVVVVPALLLLSVLYAFVWVLYFLNVILLTEIPLF